MERVIEKNRTYRIPKENGETDLYHVLETGRSLKVKDLKTNKIKNIDKQNFQTRLNQGEIYVSAKQHALGAGEMTQEDIERNGAFYDHRLFLEGICKDAGISCKVKPFDAYQGPYALLKNGGKLWMLEDDGVFYEGPSGPKTFDGEDFINDAVEFLSHTINRLKLVHKTNETNKGLKEPKKKSTVDERKHLRLIKSTLLKVLAKLIDK